MSIGCEERVVIVENLDWFGGWKGNRCRLCSRYRLYTWRGTHAGCGDVLMVVTSVDPRRGGLFVPEPSFNLGAALALRFSTLSST